ncbi:flavin monoamine oxidase family protein [Pseudonocardia endophytica]|uniref:Monoamine oxidase n=1 Tax=Pseudonocardia endophytica TaxID=401976 RepID=A0A4R1HWL6_PSEEN|nr:NAD(P)/FAD-dependent oxidoreductase [Pseudonocardia endophytica]TCK21932.1 monoamine oxidase [Pseudonocardia endophytica]
MRDKDRVTAEPFGAVVVGGGLAGVTAARDLEHSGTRTLLVEARDRLGGRTASQTIGGHEVDTGGTWFHWFQSAIWREVMRYELPVVESALTVADSYLTVDDTGVTTISATEFDERLRRGYASFWGDPGYAEAFVRPFALQTDPRARALDALSIEDRFRQLALDPRDERVLRGVLADFGPPEEVSLAWVLQRMANGVWGHEAFNALLAVYRLEGGMAGLISEMVHDGGFEVRLSSPVTAIEHDNAGATVTLAGGHQVSAPTVVVATPTNVWKTIEFRPGLGQVHRAATQEGVAMRDVSNVMMHVRGPAEPVVALLPVGSRPFEIMITHSVLDDGQLLAAYSLTGAVSVADGHENVQDAVRSLLPEVELVDVVGHDWPTDPYALGGWGSFRRGQALRFVDVLDRPVGSLIFAGADIAPQFPGLLTGAIESGARAARRVTGRSRGEHRSPRSLTAAYRRGGGFR